MTPKNTNKNKQALYAQYWGQEVRMRNEKLFLRPISSITDEELLEVGRMLLSGTVHIEHRDSNKVTLENNLVSQCYVWFDGEVHVEEYVQAVPLSILEVYDYLRAQGFALPFRGITVDEQIEFRWIELSESNYKINGALPKP